ncbi:FAD-containing oxidoreductase [Aminobacter ciceronei]|uniref:Pyruvate/2-oxoglutarate dehydrogenase complex dihydrolipoamide dehydrogenase (E3) component n=1 Tax=Aminobacter ciceronei TaxID=150723 RepID=A0ABR6CFE7_9HYPH|nr:FAD-containing oxidoreductase [Aminobacter ciceronei]MBA8910032.1 pyruvate/2-oxoglutarate dehydrogenase complex dihydrolipoamide dehydrogenase (E3) component [Aminobacter ciceronei]MBA9023774.1 pyruvate/2-oxoglutarate dehydrogenase complex dihydrolipoamide dehydrogenase (E3) component [Aminobacter ciceronei]
MSTAQRFDAIIIGCGQAGPPLAGRLTAAGQTVALIERKLVGGTCVNTGCKPTKTMVASAYAAHLARTGADYGVSTGDVSVDMKAVKARKDKVTVDSRSGLEDWIGGMKGCTLYRGHARFEGPHEVLVGDELLHGERIFINVGGRANIPDMPGINDISYLTNTSMMEVDFLPRHLVVVGGSYIGLEFAQMFRRFGAQVTVVEKGPRLISREDEDVSEAVRGILEHEGIALRLNAECISFARHPDGVTVGVDCTSGDRAVTGSHVLLAIGRKPNTDDLGLDRAGVATDKHGYIEVDDQLRTNVPHIWAMGDCNGKGAFTHTAYNDFEIVAANLLDNDPRKVSDRIEAYALYVDPPLGRAGMTETAARKSGRKVLAGQRPMTRVGRAVEKGETQGFMKILVDADTRQILGASVLGIGGDEAIHAVLDLMYARAPIETLQRAVHIHPTVSELLPTIAIELKPLA